MLLRFSVPLVFAISLIGGFMVANSLEESDLPDFLKRFDTNNDHQIDEEERQAIRDLRADLRKENRESIDFDQDGDVSTEETSSVREKIREGITKRRQQKFLAIAGEDQMISPREYGTIPGIEKLPDSTYQIIWKHLDADNSGAVSHDEFLGTLRSHESPSK